MIFAPGCFARMPTASSAVVVEPDSPRPCSSTRNTRSASPSNARPTSAPSSATRLRRSVWFAGWIGSAGWFGNVPSSSGKSTSSSIGSLSNTRGTIRPPIPFAVSATTFIGRSALTSMNECTWATNSSSRSTVDSAPRVGRVSPSRSSAAVACLISSRPLSTPTGRAPERQSLMPLYAAGLCDAVSIAPGASSLPAAK